MDKYECRVYWFSVDNCWIAHSMYTDQIGTGETPVEALQDMVKAVDQVFELAKEDETVQPWRYAPGIGHYEDLKKWLIKNQYN